MSDVAHQVFDYPHILAYLVNNCHYRPGWHAYLEHQDSRDQRGHSAGLTLVIRTMGYNAYRPEDGESYSVFHYFPVIPATYNYASWRRWLFEQFLKVEQHEAMEFFKIGEETPYAPHHGPGNDPYVIFEHGTQEDVKTSYRGEMNA